MSGPELLVAETVAATATAAETAAAAEAISAAIAAAEAEAAMIAAAESAAAESVASNFMGQNLLSAESLLEQQIAGESILAQQEAAANAMQAYANAGMADPFEKFLQYGVDADAPGATVRSLQSGFSNAPINTLKSLPQYFGMSAGGPSTMQTVYGANMAKQMLGGSGKPQTTTSSTQIKPGQQVNMVQPITSLLAPQIRRKRGISLL